MISVTSVDSCSNRGEAQCGVVMVHGFVRLEFEGDAIYLHQEDYLNGLSRNGFWLDVPADMRKSKAEVDQQYLLGVGKFNATKTGHMDMFGGTIERITRWTIWDVAKELKPAPLEPKRERISFYIRVALVLLLVFGVGYGAGRNRRRTYAA